MFVKQYSNINCDKKNVVLFIPDTIIIPNNPTKSERAKSMLGGTPITKDTAIVRHVLWSTKGDVFHTHCAMEPYSYSLEQDVLHCGLYNKDIIKITYDITFHSWSLRTLSNKK